MRIAQSTTIASVLLLAAAGSAPAQQTQPAGMVPRLIRFTNTFHPANGLAMSPVESMTLSIYHDQYGGTPLWTETQNVNVDTDGHYTAMLGATLPDGVPADLFATAEPRWLGVQFNRPAETEQPRVLLVSVPYALKAADADTLGGKPASAYMLAPSVTASATTSTAPASTAATPGSTLQNAALKPRATTGSTGCIGVFTDSSDIGCSTMWQSGGFIGINTASPSRLLTIADSTSGGPIQFSVTNTSSSGRANFNLLNDQGYYIGVQMAGSSYTGSTHPNLHNQAAIFAQGSGVSAFVIQSNGETGTGGTTPIEFEAGGYNNTPGVYIAPGSPGNVGIGTVSPAYNLDVAGNMNFSGKLSYSGTTVLQFPGGAATNFAFGASALQGNSTGVHNTATGTLTLFSNNSGSYNTAVGEGALDANSSGSNNTAVGFDTLLSNSGGSNNIAVGYEAGSSVSGSNNIDIGNQGSSSDSGVIRIGGSSQNSLFAAGIYGVNVSGVPVYVTSSGQLGISSSSRRFKEDIHDMGDASSGLLRLRPVTFRYKKPFADGTKPIQYGLIAEEVAEVYPDMVAHTADGKIETVKYQMLAPMLLNELQRQQREIQTQKDQVRSLQEQLEAQQHATIDLQQHLATLETEMAATIR